MSTKQAWVKVPDNCIRHVWKRAEDDTCDTGHTTSIVSPDWYAENGTPICECGEDMEYDYAEVDLGTLVRIRVGDFYAPIEEEGG